MEKDFGEILKDLRESRGYSQQELGEALNMTRQTISNYEKGRRTPHKEILEEIADFFNVDMDFLYGKTKIENRYRQKLAEGANFELIELSPYASVPVLGSIPAGVPIEAIEDIVDHIDIPLKWVKSDDVYFALKVRGDSMYPLFLDGDTVIIRRQTTAETGDICACYVNGFDATLKRVKISEAGAITLQPENTNYPPMTYTHPGEVTIAGKVVEVRRPV